MINKNELRAGSFVDFLTEGDIQMPMGKAARVSEIKFVTVTFINPHDEFNIELPYNRITPIPLTEDWLLKFGFKKNDNWGNYGDLAYEKEALTLVYKGGKYWQCDASVKWKCLDFVHSLQNRYFALIADELRIKSEVHTSSS